MKVIRGDLLSLAVAGQFDVIVHGCNCQCAMKRGIAADIRRRFLEAYAVDLTTSKGDRAKLGTFSSTLILRGEVSFTVVNAYTQFNWVGNGVLADYDAIPRAFRAVRGQFRGKRIGYPRIGAGLAGGEWLTIAAIIDEELAGEDHTLVEFEPTNDSRVGDL